MSYYSSFYQPPTPCPPWFDDDVRSRTDDFMEFQGGIPEDDLFGNKDVHYPQSTPSSMRSSSYHNDDNREFFLLLSALISLLVPIICWITYAGDNLGCLGFFRICLFPMIMIVSGNYEQAGFELLGGILWIVIEKTKIYKRRERTLENHIIQRRSDREQRERVEGIPEDVEDPIVLTTTEDNLPTAVADHRINSRLPREDMRTTLQGRVNYHEIVHAEIVDMGSSSTSTQVGDPQNAPSWNPYGEAEYSGPAAIAVPERGVGMGLEPHSNRFEEVVINRPRFFTFIN
jgi:hypothetical protein